MSSVVKTRPFLLVRIMGLVLFTSGLLLAYYTADTSLVPQIVPVFYLVSLILIIPGFLALVAKIT